MLIMFLGLVLLLCAVYGATQGLFSSFIQLVLVILAGVLAFAFWEPVTALIMPRSISIPFIWDGPSLSDASWGIGLLLPFGIFLALLRLAADKLVPGNLDFHNLVHKIGGGVCGFLAGIVTTGMLLIGFQMIDMPSTGYTPFKLAADGSPQRQDNLPIPIDSIAAGLFTSLSDGAYSPIFSKWTLSRAHPDLEVEVGLYPQSETPSSSRSIRSDFVSLIEGEYYLCTGAIDKTVINNADPALATVVIGTQVQLSGKDRATGAADRDRILRITRPQVQLAHRGPDGATHVAFPIGYIQRDDYESMQPEGSFARSGVGDVEKYHWVFQIPAGNEPVYLRLKNTRLMLPYNAQPVQEIAKVQALITKDAATEVASNGKGPNDRKKPDLEVDFAKISDRLPFPLNRNELINADLNDDAIIAGQTEARESRVNRNLAVNRVYVNPGVAAVVQIIVGKPADKNSLLSAIVQTATLTTQPPVLVDDKGTQYFATGYARHQPGLVKLSIDPSKQIRSLNELDIGSLADDETLILYYIVEKRRTIEEWRVGPEWSRPISMYVE